MPCKLEYRDFVVRIGPHREGEHRAVTAESEAGEAEGRFAVPFGDDERVWLDGALTPRQVTLASESGALAPEEVGGRLFQALFRGLVGALFAKTRGRLGDEVGLRLRLRLPDDLLELPWELLYEREVDTFLTLNRRVSIERHLDLPQPTAAVRPPSTLRVLAVAPPSPGLDLERERRELAAALSAHAGVELAFATAADTGSLRRRLLDDGVHVLHFMGHGGLAAAGGRLVFATADGRPDEVDGRGLAVEIGDIRSLRLVVLNACDSARPGERAAGGVAGALMRAGVPAVLAMQAPISDAAAIAFSRTFYDRLAAGDPLDAAVTEGRIAIHRTLRDLGEAAEWAIPVLYARAPLGALLASSPELVTAVPPRRPGGVAVALAALALATASAVWLARPQPVPAPVLSEVFVDADGVDQGLEWVELYNPGREAIDLAGFSLGAGGADFTVTLAQLSGVIEPGAVFVAGGPVSDERNGRPVFDRALDFHPNLQNSGAAADGVALFACPAAQVTAATVPLDAVIYGGANLNDLLDPGGGIGRPDVGAARRGASIERIRISESEPEWRLTSRPSPGTTPLASTGRRSPG